MTSDETEEQAQDEIDAQEGLAMLLGGLATCDMTSVEWDAKEEDDTMREQQKQPQSSSALSILTPRTKRMVHHIPVGNSSPSPEQNSPDVLFSQCCDRAFSISSNGNISKPPVSIVDMSNINNRGFSLIANRNIRRGELIYTERATEACQMPAPEGLYRVRGCQYCFRSLEPASSILCMDSACKEIPMAEYWPIPEYQIASSLTNINGERRDCDHCYLDSKTGRVHCRDCQSLFCSKQCFDNLNKKMGSCCQCAGAIKAAIHATSCSEEADEKDRHSVINVEPSIVLAARAFCAEVQKHRSIGGQCNNSIATPSPFHGMCGDRRDIEPLELGVLRLKDGQDTPKYSLEGMYAALCNALSLSDEEGAAFPLASFERLAAVAARNGFNITTQSPFRAYYSAFMRANGGRNSVRHKEAVKQLAYALGSQDGELQRDMDHEVEAKVGPYAIYMFGASIFFDISPIF